MSADLLRLPWRAECGFIYDKEDRENVADFRGADRFAIADEVARRVNAHNRLVDALVMARNVLKLTDENFGGDIPCWEERDAVFEALDSLLSDLGVSCDAPNTDGGSVPT